jgi:tRNA(Ile2)-agmatinylcytidine synthase
METASSPGAYIKMLIGIDDTDSLKGGCTTYLAALLCEKLGATTAPFSERKALAERKGISFGNSTKGGRVDKGGNVFPALIGTTGLPKLVRLNPNVPYKTRGNGAVALEVNGNPEEIKQTVLTLVKKHSHLKEEGTNPGIVFIEKLTHEKEKILNGFYGKAVSELVTMKEAEKIAKKVKAEIHKFNNGRGVIGALAATGFSGEKTYELMAYRTEKNYGKEKGIEAKSIFEMDRKTFPETFDNTDPETKQILITPHGYDPVFCGIRGINAEIVETAFGLIKPLEEIERIQVFETNQATDAHLINKKISELKPYDCAVLKGRVVLDPQSIEGGHVIFGFSDGTGKIACAAYEPTGRFRDTARKLKEGDELMVYGGIGKYTTTLNLEKINILKLGKINEKTPPECCGRRMTSAGKNKGFKCRKCGKRGGEERSVLREIPREPKPGFYEVPPRARRHLSRPLILRNPRY